MIEIMKKVYDLTIEIRIGGFEFFPIPEAFIQNCAFCNRDLDNAIAEYNATKNLQSLLALDCYCKKRHDNEIFQEKSLLNKNFLTRVYEMLELE